MRGRLKLVALTAGAIAAAGVGAGAIAATTGRSGDPAADLAAAINKRAGTSITGEDVKGAFKDLLKARLDADVAAGRLTRAQADAILERAGNDMPPLGHLRFRGPHGPRANVLAPVAKLLKTSEADLRATLRSGSTLAQVAKERGVSRADLLATIEKALRSSGPGDLTDEQLRALAARIADGPPAGGRQFHHRWGGPGPGPLGPPLP